MAPVQYSANVTVFGKERPVLNGFGHGDRFGKKTETSFEKSK